METDDAPQMLHVFDLPQIYTKPPADILLDTLLLLTSAPPSWEGSDTEDESTPPGRLVTRRPSEATKPVAPLIDPEGLTRYLTTIIASDLGWIQGEEAKEGIWHQASLRLSELSGRSALPAMSRTFRIPTRSGRIDITLHEPALTADNLGFKTWGASYLLAKRLHKIPIPALSDSSDNAILELGAGTGLVGIAAAAVYGVPVVLTDLPDITANLFRNINTNKETVQENGGSTHCGSLDWKQPGAFTAFLDDPVVGKGEDTPSFISPSNRFKTILAADSLYSEEHPKLLVQTIEARLSADETARVIVEFPKRDDWTNLLIKDFQERMSSVGLCRLQQDEETGLDDWGREEVRCWFSIWVRRKAGKGSP